MAVPVFVDPIFSSSQPIAPSQAGPTFRVLNSQSTSSVVASTPTPTYTPVGTQGAASSATPSIQAQGLSGKQAKFLEDYMSWISLPSTADENARKAATNKLLKDLELLANSNGESETATPSRTPTGDRGGSSGGGPEQTPSPTSSPTSSPSVTPSPTESPNDMNKRDDVPDVSSQHVGSHLDKREEATQTYTNTDTAPEPTSTTTEDAAAA